jgi:hypothetical protein
MKDLQSEARIRDLEQRMAAMPGSRIFVGLAEEYRRAGRFADALAILRNGLEAHPTYLSARIAIARLYQETGHVRKPSTPFQGARVDRRISWPPRRSGISGRQEYRRNHQGRSNHRRCRGIGRSTSGLPLSNAR